ncbi:recombinase family protein [Butyricicoccus faecihominis]|uniref:recombinase family protein n=1 Tax=Butyricicoccus faecihominis TaxID=1712515 RepID=UPI002479C3D3|nr:recombinase family protein [Butyricicoccus faecihominis]MCQ5128048.1 recombinase family protein [Butyricicoccus faecihominis]
MDVRMMDDMQAAGRGIFDMKIAVAYYARVSTEKDEQLNSLDNQRRYYEEYIRSIPNWTFAGGYVDEGISGTSVAKRERFLKMIEDAKAGEFDLIITKEISRFARNTLDSIGYTRELLRHGVGVYFQNDNINTFDKDAELRLTIMSSIAQDEVRKLSERTRFGFKRAQENSVLLGQNNLYGYNKADGRLEIVESEASVVREVFERYVAGDLGLRAIANDLDSRGILGKQGRPITYSTLYGMIRNPKYKGFYAGRRYATRDYRDGRTYRLGEDKWIVHEDERVPAIVPEPLWEQANRLLASRGKTMKRHAQASQNRYAYSGKLICAKHGTTFHRHVYKSKRRGETECWNCKLYRLKGKAGGCDSPTVYSSELDRILEKVFEKVATEKNAAMQEYIDDLRLYASRQDHGEELEKLEQEITALSNKKEKLLELTLAGALTNEEFGRRNEQYNEMLSELETKKSRLSNAGKTIEERIHRIEQLAKTIEEQWKKNCGFSREMSKALVDHIVVDADETNTKIYLEIHLSMDKTYEVEYEKPKKKNNVISFEEFHISQAQVSRLEKGAIDRIRKQI